MSLGVRGCHGDFYRIDRMLFDLFVFFLTEGEVEVSRGGKFLSTMGQGKVRFSL